jgi:group I intron endonuclease
MGNLYVKLFFDCGVYLIRNKTNDKVYVGSAVSIRTRWARHLKMLRSRTHDNIKLQRAWDKHGESAFEFEIAANCPHEELLRAEQLAIDAFDAVNTGYNIAKVAGSSMRNRTHSEATKLQMSRTRRGRKQTSEWVSRRVSSFKGMELSAEHKEKISVALRGRVSEGTARSLRAIAATRNPDYTAWLGRKGAASRWGVPFHDPKPDMYLSNSELRIPSTEVPITAKEQ